MRDQTYHQSSNQAPSTVPYRMDPAAEDSYWRGTYADEGYYDKRYDFDDYSPAYRLGYEGRDRYSTHSYEDVEEKLSKEWDEVKGQSRLAWDEARHAVRAGWHRVERALPGDADADGR